jgi:DedD protein
MAGEETEITLGAGKLLGLFLMLAATCGIFFAVGYSLGKTSAREQALKNLPAQSDSTIPGAESGKPAASPPSNAASSNGQADAGKNPDPNLTFYKGVKESPRDDTTPAPGMKSVAEGASPSAPAAKQAETPATSPSMSAKAVPSRTVPPVGPAQPTLQASPSGNYVVQIAAVTHEEDAAALAGALRKKSYAASVVNNPAGKDKLFHVVLGPYATLQDAEAMKAKLQGEGYNPIVKR